MSAAEAGSKTNTKSQSSQPEFSQAHLPTLPEVTLAGINEEEMLEIANSSNFTRPINDDVKASNDSGYLT